MKKNYLTLSAVPVLLSMLLVPLQSFAADYSVSFAGAGVSTNVDSVIVQNLTKGTKVKVLAGSALTLSVATSIDQSKAAGQEISIYPNPIQQESTVKFYAKEAGAAQISIFGVDGKSYGAISKSFNAGDNSFQLSLPVGAYVVKVSGNGYAYVSKAISKASSISQPKISFIENTEKVALLAQNKVSGVSLRSASADVAMDYADGDILLYKGYSGDYSSVVKDVPTESKAITFKFAKCTEGTSVYYEDFSWLTYGSAIFYNTTGETRYDSWTETQKAYCTSTSVAAGDTPLYGRPGFIKLGRTAVGGDFISPNLSNIVGTQNVVVKFKAVPYKTSGGTLDDDSLTISVIGPGVISHPEVFIIDNWPIYPTATDVREAFCIEFWTPAEAERSFTITGATSETQIKFLAGKYNLTGVGAGKNRIFIDDITVYLPK